MHGLASACGRAVACLHFAPSTIVSDYCERLLSVVATAASSLSSLHAAGLTSLEDGSCASLDVLLAGDADHEGWDVDHGLADGDVSLEDEDAGVVDRVGEVTLLDERLKSALQELRSGQTEHIIELALVVLQETQSHHSADEGLTY